MRLYEVMGYLIDSDKRAWSDNLVICPTVHLSHFYFILRKFNSYSCTIQHLFSEPVHVWHESQPTEVCDLRSQGFLWFSLFSIRKNVAPTGPLIIVRN